MTSPGTTTTSAGRSAVSARVENGVGYLTLDRPDKRNALDEAMREAIQKRLREWRHDDTVRVVVITGSGKSFAAGADLEELLERTPEEQRDFISPPHIYEAVATFPYPVIAAVNGHALGAGCELMLACDLRIASDEAKIGQPEINLGLIPGGGGTQRLPRLVGHGRAMRLVLTGEVLAADEALDIGLVDEVVPAERFFAHVVTFAETLAAKSPIALRTAKKAVRTAWNTTLEQGLGREIDLFMETFQSEESKQRIRAFLDKRKA